MIVLGIDTSCDDTCVSILEIEKLNLTIKSNLVSSQVKLHEKYGGVFPTLAKREHQRNLPIVFQKALEIAKKPQIDLIAVTIGPGLEICLWQGINFAKNLAKEKNIPIIPVNHIEAHLLSTFLNYPFKLLKFPAVCLIVSGGHTQLIFMEKIGKYKLLGETRDDAAGECFDKVARLLNLGYPGGPIIEKLANVKLKNLKYQIHLPRPMINQKNYDFSFAGLKTAVLYDFLKRSQKVKKSRQYKVEIVKEVQQAIIDVLVEKTIRAMKFFKSKTLLIGGGVAANRELRKQLKRKVKKEFPKIEYLAPKIEFCTDNAAMVALTGYFHRQKILSNFDKIRAEANLKI